MVQCKNEKAEQVQPELEEEKVEATHAEQPEMEESTMNQVADEANVEKIITNGVYRSVGIGLIPIPIVDFIGLTAIQIKMLHSLSQEYNLEFSEERSKAIIGALISGFLPLTLVRTVASLFKAIPIIGQTTGALTTSILGGASTYAIGRVFNRHFASGGTFLDLEPEKVKEYFKKQFEEGKSFVKSASNKVKGTKHTAPAEETEEVKS